MELPVLDSVGVGLKGLALLLAVEVNEGVGQDAVQPGLEVGARTVLVEGGEGLGVNLLDEVLGVGAVARHAQGGAVELVEVGQGIGLEARGARRLILVSRSAVEALGINVVNVMVVMVPGRGVVNGGVNMIQSKLK